MRGRLGENEPTLVDALGQLRLAFVQLRSSEESNDRLTRLSAGRDPASRFPVPLRPGDDVERHQRADLDRPRAVGDRGAVEEVLDGGAVSRTVP